MDLGGKASALPLFCFYPQYSLVRIILDRVLRRAIHGRSSAISVLCHHKSSVAGHRNKFNWSELMKVTFQPLRSAMMLGLVITASLVSGCDFKAKVDIEEAGTVAFIEPVIRTPIAGRPTAGYFGYERSYNTTDQIIAVASPAFKRVEMHDSVTEGGMKKMVKLDTLDLPAKSSIKFAPGGKHLMLFEPTKELKGGDQIKVTFVFAEQSPMVVTFDVRDVVPVTGIQETMDHGSMDHGAMGHGDKKP